jgi:cytoskeletal protein RodZ
MSWRERLRDRMAGWPLRDRLLTLVALAMVGLIVFSLVARDDGRPSRTVADVTRTTGAPRAEVTTTAPSTEPSTLQADPAPTAATEPPVTAASPPATTTPPTTTAPPTTVRRAVSTTAPTTTSPVGPFCGFVPGAIVDIDLNGRPSGRQTADGKGCVTVDR